MAAHIELAIAVTNQQQKDILVALLTEAGAAGFEEGRDYLKVFVHASDFEEFLYKKLLSKMI